jgi:hypothetical protein
MSRPGGRDAVSRAQELVGFFHANPAAFAGFAAVSAKRLPAGPRQLLDHASHMTVAMERFHGGPVGLRVVSRREDAAGRYAREILLTQAAGKVVQHGIVRIDLGRLAPDVATEIRGEATPLGRILLNAGLLSDVHDVELLEITPGPHLESLFSRGAATAAIPTFGRVAAIGLDGSPAIELLEIVAPGTAD